MTINNLEQVVLTLMEVKEEPVPNTKLKILKKALQDESQFEGLSLILSFQITSPWRTLYPSFNLISARAIPLKEAVRKLLASKFSVTVFKSLPYVYQQALSFMSDPSTIGLRTSQIIGLEFKHTEVLSVLLDILPKYAKSDGTCQLCHIRSELNLCLDCINELLEFTEFRHTDFTLTLNSQNWRRAPADTISLSSVDISNGVYQVTSTDEKMLQFNLRPVTPHQLTLPFIEYQRSL